MNSKISSSEAEEVLLKNIKSEIIEKKKSLENIKSNQESKHLRLRMQILGAFTCAWVHLAIGTMVGFTGVTLPAMMNPNSTDLILSQFEATIFSSITNAGIILGSLMSTLVMVWIGQKSSLLYFLPIAILSWLLLAFSQTYWMLVSSRLLQGTVAGIVSACANSYIIEIAHSSVRGRLSGLIDMHRQIGFLFVYMVGSTNLTWRMVALTSGVSAFSVPLIGVLFLPHSPRWLAMRGRIEEARESMTIFRGPHYDTEQEIMDISNQLSSSSSKGSVIDQIKQLKQPSILRIFIILAFILFASSFTGNFAIAAYSVSIFESANVDINPYLSTNIAAAGRVLGSLMYVLVADTFNRKSLVMGASFMSGLCMITLGSFFYLQFLLYDIPYLFWMPLVSIVLYNFFFSMANPVLMVMMSELLPTSVRAVGIGLLFVIYFSGTFAVTLSYPFMAKYIGSYITFWLYGATAFMIVLVIWILIPDTQGKSLEEIEHLFKKKNNTSTNKQKC